MMTDLALVGVKAVKAPAATSESCRMSEASALASLASVRRLQIDSTTHTVEMRPASGRARGRAGQPPQPAFFSEARSLRHTGSHTTGTTTTTGRAIGGGGGGRVWSLLVVEMVVVLLLLLLMV